MRTRTLGRTGPEVSALGLGAMGMSGAYGPTDRAESIATVHAALDAGVTLIDTGDFYGMGHNELLLGRGAAGPRARQLPAERQVRRAAGAGHGFGGHDARPAAVKNFLAYSLTRLGTDYVDVYRPARLDPAVPIEETVGAIKEMIDAGYVRHLGLSEVGADGDPPGARRASGRRPADRVLADLPRGRGRGPAHAAGARHRHDRVRGAEPGAHLRALVAGRGGAPGDSRSA